MLQCAPSDDVLSLVRVDNSSSRRGLYFDFYGVAYFRLSLQLYAMVVEISLQRYLQNGSSRRLRVAN